MHDTLTELYWCRCRGGRESSSSAADRDIRSQIPIQEIDILWVVLTHRLYFVINRLFIEVTSSYTARFIFLIITPTVGQRRRSGTVSRRISSPTRLTPAVQGHRPQFGPVPCARQAVT